MRLRSYFSSFNNQPMKQINLVLSLHFFAFIMIFQTPAFAQAPQWQWVRGGGSASDSSYTTI
jgi:hypothetical protein